MAEKIGLEAILDLTNFNRNMSQYQKGIGNMTRDTEKAGGVMGRAFDGVGKSIKNTGLLLTGAIATGAAVAATAITAFTVSGINKAADLEAQLGGIAAVLGKTKAEVAPLNDLILQLGLDPNLKVNAQEAADAIELLARNGLDMTEILNGAAKATVLLANSTGADFGTSANIATDAMAIFKIGAEDMMEAVNGITSVTTNSKFDINDYALALSQGGGVASAAGVSFDDFNTSIAAISPLFASGSDAGTSFKTMLMRLNPQSDAAADAMKALGLNFYDAQGQMKSMAEIATELNDAFFQEVTFSSTVSNATAEQTSQRKLLEQQIKRTNTELYKYQVGINGVAQSEADKAVSIDRLNRQHDAAIAAYGGLASALGTTVSVTRQLTEEEKNQYLTTLFGTDASRAAIALAESGNVVYTDLALAIKETGLSQEILNGYMQDGELTAFELLQAQQGLTDASAAAATRMDNFRGVMEILSGAIETIQIQIGQAFLPLLRQIAEMFTGLVSQHGPAIVAMFEDFAEQLSFLVQWLLAAASTGDIFNDWLEELPAAFQSAIATSAVFIGALVWLGTVVGNLVAPFVEWKDVLIVLGALIAYTIIPIIGALAAPFLTTIAVIAGAILAVAAIRTAWESNFLGIRDATLGALSAIQTAFEPLTSAIQTHLAGAMTEIQNWAAGNETEFTNVKAIWEGAKTSAQNLFDGIIGFATTNLPTWQANLTEWATAASVWVTNATTAALGYLAQWVTAITGYVSAQLPTWQANLTEWATAAWQWIVDAAALLAAKIGEWYTSLKAAVDAKLPTWKTAFNDWKAATWQWIIDAGALLPAKIGEWAIGLIKALAANLPKFIANLLSWAAALIKWVTSKEANVIPNLGTWLGKVLAWMVLAGLAMTVQAVKWAWALLSWIVTDLIPGIGPNLWKFLIEFLAGLGRISLSLFQFAGNFAIGFWNTISEHVDWQDLGATIMRKIKLGVITIRNDFFAVLLNIVTSVHDFFFKTDWLQVGKDVITFVTNGIEDLLGVTSITSAMTEIGGKMVKAMANIKWLDLGKSIIDGIKKGLEAKGQEIIDYIVGLGKDALEEVKKFFGISSPSKVFAEIGRNLIEGWIIGMRQTAPQLLAEIQRISGEMFGIVLSQRSRTLAGLSGDIGGLTGLGSNFINVIKDEISSIEDELKKQVADIVFFEGGFSIVLDPGQKIDWAAIQRRNVLLSSTKAFETQKKITDTLQMQAGLIEYVSNAGLNVQQFFQGIKLGPDADPAQILQRLTSATMSMNQALEAAINVATKGYDKLVENMRQGRESFDEIMDDFTLDPADPLTVFQRQLDALDAQIARIEEDILKTGNDYSVRLLENVTTQREQIADEIRRYVIVLRDAQNQFARIQTTTNARAQDVAKEYTKTFIEPLLKYIQSPLTSAYTRDQLVKTITERTDAINYYIQRAQNLAQIEASIQSAAGINPLVDRFIAQRIDPLIDRLYDINLTEAERVRITQQLAAEQSKLLAIQEKQQKLDFLQQQLDLFSQIEQLNDQFDDIIPMESILSGIKFGLDASLDDMLELTSRSIDAIIKTIKHQLGIASPSKVFAEIGANLMQGLGRGMMGALRYPLTAMQGAAQQLTTSINNSRNMVVNMGGVQISNGMDDVLFEARVRQVVEGMF